MHIVSKFVPLAAVPGVALLWLLCTAAIDFLAGLPITDVRSAALAVPFALVFFSASEPLEAIFDHWY